MAYEKLTDGVPYVIWGHSVARAEGYCRDSGDERRQDTASGVDNVDVERERYDICVKCID